MPDGYVAETLTSWIVPTPMETIVKTRHVHSTEETRHLLVPFIHHDFCDDVRSNAVEFLDDISVG